MSLSSPEEAPGEKVKVFVRCRRLNDNQREVVGGRGVSVSQSLGSITVKSPAEKTFTFERVLGENSKQSALYDSVDTLADAVLDGYNSTVIVYGQTGTGKTRILEGDSLFGDSVNSGLIVSAARRMLSQIDPNSPLTTVKISFFELYNEELFDPFGTDDSLKTLIEDSITRGLVLVKNVGQKTVRDLSHVKQLLERRISIRLETALQRKVPSSRSHIFSCLTLIRRDSSLPDADIRISKLTFVDLAGSDNLGPAASRDEKALEKDDGKRGLLVLDRVVDALADGSQDGPNKYSYSLEFAARVYHMNPHVEWHDSPFKESHLTQLLEDSLGGRTKTLIIGTISPAAVDVDETVSTLEWLSRAKEITNYPTLNLKVNMKKFVAKV